MNKKQFKKQLTRIKEERDAKIADLEDKLCIAEAKTAEAEAKTAEAEAKTAEAVVAKDEAVLETEKVRAEFEDFKELDEEQFGGLLKVMIKFLDHCDDYFDESEAMKIINDSEILREIAEEKGLSTEGINYDGWKYQVHQTEKREKEIRNMIDGTINRFKNDLEEIMKKMAYYDY